jgi:hypothetical protein
VLNEMKRAIERELRVVMTIKTGHAGKRRVTIIEKESRRGGDLSKVSQDPFFKGRPPLDAQNKLPQADNGSSTGCYSMSTGLITDEPIEQACLRLRKFAECCDAR